MVAIRGAASGESPAVSGKGYVRLDNCGHRPHLTTVRYGSRHISSICGACTYLDAGTAICFEKAACAIQYQNCSLLQASHYWACSLAVARQLCSRRSMPVRTIKAYVPIRTSYLTPVMILSWMCMRCLAPRQHRSWSFSTVATGIAASGNDIAGWVSAWRGKAGLW